MTSNLEILLAMAVALLIPLGAAAHGFWMLHQGRKEMREISKLLGESEDLDRPSGRF